MTKENDKKNRGFTIIDDFMEATYFKQLEEIVLGDNFPWFFQKQVNDFDKENSYFTHNLYDKFAPCSNFWGHFVNLALRLEPKAFIRVKMNCYPRTSKIVKHASHVDTDYDHKGAIFYWNTNNGKTILEDGTEIDSVANRMLLFNAAEPHQSTSCTDAPARYNMNFNFFK